jgi:hypothetical protein
MDKIQPTMLFVHFPYCLISNNDSFQDTINFYVALKKMLTFKFNFHFKVIFVVKCVFKVSVMMLKTFLNTAVLSN